MVAADRLLNQIGRSLMTDKLMACLLLLLLVGIIVIIVGKVMGVGSKENSHSVYVIDCSLEWTRNSPECKKLAGDPDAHP